jgi:DNA-binding GntR family transcriptional regulator
MVEPLYRQIADDLRTKIESGELAQGSQLATEGELKDQYNASRNTVRDAIKWLTTLGLVETRPGQGTFVTEKINPFVTTLTGNPETAGGGGDGSIYVAEVQAYGRTSTNSDPRVEIQRATRVVARALRLDEGAQVVSRHQERLIDDTPWSLQTTFYPMGLVERGATRLILPTDIHQGAVAYLARECDIKQVGYRDTIAVRPPDENEAWFFKLPADGSISVFEVHRIGFDQKGDRIRLTVTVYPADRNRFRVNVGNVPPKDATVQAAQDDESAPVTSGPDLQYSG